MKKLHIKTFGCQMNEYDSKKMYDLLALTHGLEKTENEADADVILLNTCSIREKPQEKVFSEIGALKPLKARNKALVIGVGGCVGSQEGEAILKRSKLVDLVFGPQTIHRLPNMLTQVTSNKPKLVDISFPAIEKFDNLPAPTVSGVSEFVTIMEGCSKYCSYCIVPYTRGEEISRPFNEVIQEVYRLSELGVKEITLLGQNVNCYQGLMPNGSTADLALLINYIAQIDSIKRIRFTTSNPLEFNERLLEAYSITPKLCNHLHLPVQSGSNKILKLMKRGHSREEYIAKVKKLRAIRPSIAITSDFIVGFPQESEQDFQDTLDLVNEIGFDLSFSFIFSKRPGVPAANLPDSTEIEVKKERLSRLQAALNNQAGAFANSLVDTYQQVLVLGPAKKGGGLFTGRADNNRVVNFSVPEGHTPEPGSIIPVKIVKANINTIYGSWHLD